MSGGHRLGQLHVEAKAVRVAHERLRRRVVDEVLAVREEAHAGPARPHPRAAPRAGELVAGERGFGGPSGGRDGKLRRARAKWDALPGTAAGSPAATAKPSVEHGLLGDADVLADQPARIRLDRDGAGLRAGGRRELGEEHHLVRVAVVHEGADPLAFRMGPLDGPGAPAFGQRPLDLRGQARVARILPVGVPVLVHAQAKAHGGGLAGGGSHAFGEELGLHVLGPHRRGMGRGRESAGKRQGEQQGGAKGGAGGASR